MPIVAKKQDDGKAYLEMKNQPIYDRKLIAVDQAQTIYFFKDFASGYTALDTNLTSPGQVGNPHEFYMYGMSMHIAQGTTVADIQKLYNYSYVKLEISGREQLKMPLHMLPDLGGMGGAIATTKNDVSHVAISNGIPMQEGYYPVSVANQPIKIRSMESFHAELIIAAPSAFSATIYATAYLHGIFGQPR